jgi:hypothetical protein
LEAQNRYLIAVALTFFGTSLVLAAMGVTALILYLSAFVIEYFACLIIYRPRTRVFNLLSTALFLFWIILVIENALV